MRIDTPGEADYYRNGGILQYVLRSLSADPTRTSNGRTPTWGAAVRRIGKPAGQHPATANR